jgi:hypothetical protein
MITVTENACNGDSLVCGNRRNGEDEGRKFLDVDDHPTEDSAPCGRNLTQEVFKGWSSLEGGAGFLASAEGSGTSLLRFSFLNQFVTFSRLVSHERLHVLTESDRAQ